MLTITLYSEILDKDVEFSVDVDDSFGETEFILTAIGETVDFDVQNDMESTYCDEIARAVSNYAGTNYIATDI